MTTATTATAVNSTSKASTDAVSASAAPVTPPVSAVSFKPISSDLAPERGHLSALYAKISEYVTSKLHSGRHLDNLEAMGSSIKAVAAVNEAIPEVGTPLQSYEALLNAAPTNLKDHVAVIGGAIGRSLKAAANEMLEATKKLDHGLMRIAGCDLAGLDAERRARLSNGQRAKISTLYRSLMGEFQSAEKGYNQTGSSIEEATKGMSALLAAEASIREKFKGADGTVTHYGQEDLAALEGKGFTGLSGKLSGLYDKMRTSIFDRIINSEAVKGKDATAIKTEVESGVKELQAVDGQIVEIIKGVRTASKVMEQNEKTAALIHDKAIPADVAKSQIVSVSASTFASVQDWFKKKSAESEQRLTSSLAGVETQEGLESFTKVSVGCQLDSKNLREVVQGIAGAVQPLVTLTDPSVVGSGPEFRAAVRGCKQEIERAAVAAMESLPHGEAIKRFAELRTFSEKVAAKAQAELATPDRLTGKEAVEIVDGLRKAIADLSRKSWV